MAEKFVVKNSKGEKVWEGMAMTKTEAISCACLFDKKLIEEELKAEVVPFATMIIVEENNTSTPVLPIKKERKPRTDKGQPRTAKSPDKPKRRPTVYHMVDGTITVFETKELLDEALSMAPDTVIFRVIAGGELHQVKCQKRFVLSK